MRINNTLEYIFIIILLSVTSVFSLNLFLHEKTSHDKLDIHNFPMRTGDWKGTDIEVTETDYKILETRNLILREYVVPSKQKIFLFIIYSETNRSVFHPPEVCLMGSGTLIANKTTEKIDLGKDSFLTNKLYLEKRGFKEIALYCYKAGSFHTENYYLQQAYLAIHQIFGKRIPGATIRVSMGVLRDEGETLAELKKFLAETVKIVDGLSSERL